jgi:hypothetical protein
MSPSEVNGINGNSSTSLRQMESSAGPVEAGDQIEASWLESRSDNREK